MLPAIRATYPFECGFSLAFGSLEVREQLQVLLAGLHAQPHLASFCKATN